MVRLWPVASGDESWEFSAPLPPPLRACAHSPSRSRTSPATSPTRRPPRFKREDTSFVDLIPDNIPAKQLAGNVVANSRSTNSVQGDIQNASVSTYMAINGQGFFVVEKPASFADNQPVFDGIDLYTRRGDFSDRQERLSGQRRRLLSDGNSGRSDHRKSCRQRAELLQFNSGFLPAQPTTQIQYQANLASYPLTGAHDTGIPGSELLKPADFSVG